MRIDLYIHKDIEHKVSQEPNRGQLINDLLKKHYGLTIEPVKPKIKADYANKTYNFCKHDAVKGFCSKGCR